jgi:DNA-binding CsgD family transcriptional regulator
VIPVVEESLSIWRGLGALDQVATALMAYGRAEQQLGNLDHACSLLLEALHLQISLGTYTGLIGCLSIMVHFARETCQPPEKHVYLARIFGVFETLQDKIGGGTSRWHEQEATSWYEMLARELGEEEMAREMGLGRALAIEGIVALAEGIVGSVRAITRSRASSLASATRKAEPTYPAGLTPREVEVLRLVADGLTNQQAADRLSVTSRTINAHLTSIYSKIGVTSRAGAVRFATEQKLI